MNSTFDNIYLELEKNWRILTSDDDNYDLPLIRSLMPTLLITNAYLLFVLKLGPAFMKSRPPYDLKWLMLPYNIAQVLLNSYAACWGFYVFLWIRPFNIGCITILPSEHPLKQRETSLSYLFCLLKFLDLSDTVFLVLRKKSNQVTFLHVYHHYITSFLCIIYIKFVGLGGHSMIFGIVNTTVHSFMYSYYFLTALRPELRAAMWLKRYITKLQITQFIILVIHNSWPLFFEPDCKHPSWLLILAVSQFLIMLVLFMSFYRRAYLTKHVTVKSINEQRKGKFVYAVGKMD